MIIQMFCKCILGGPRGLQDDLQALSFAQRAP